jgi:hypothetical protein
MKMKNVKVVKGKLIPLNVNVKCHEGPKDKKTINIYPSDIERGHVVFFDPIEHKRYQYNVELSENVYSLKFFGELEINS